METLVAFGSLAAAGYLLATADAPVTHEHVDGTLVDFTVQGCTDDVALAVKNGYRLIELHVYADEQDQPIVKNVSFESCCIDIVNDAFPSDTPLILSIVPHTESSFTLNRIAYHIKTTVRKHLVQGSVHGKTLGELANRIVIVSGSEVRGTELEPLVNLSWNDSHLRRLSYQQAAHPRDPAELRGFAAKNIVIVAPDQAFARFKIMDDVYAYGCQWNLCPSPQSRPGFISRG